MSNLTSPSSGNNLNTLPQIYIGGPQHQGGLNGVKKSIKPSPGGMSIAKSKSMLNKARGAGGDANKFMPSRTQGVI